MEKAREELINLYLNIKIRTQEEVIIIINYFLQLKKLQVEYLTEDNLLKEAENIINLPLTDLVEYIKSTIDIIVSLKVDAKLSDYKNFLNEDNNSATEYETLLQKLEASIRQHISYEHQFKIEYEKLLNKAEEIDSEKKILIKQIVK